MNTNVEALQRLYVKMGGNPEDVSDKTTISEMIDAITAIGIVDRVARSGNYITATTAAEMDNTGAIYVYTGSETGYNQGHLYYWDGTAFVDGGEYNGARAEIDPTLSHTGKGADAKVVGDKISEINGSLDTVQSDLNEISGKVLHVSPNLLNFDDPDFLARYYINPSNGQKQATSTYNTTGYIEVEEGEIYTYTYGSVIGTAQSMRFITAYDAEKNVISSAGAQSVTKYTAPAGVTYIRVSATATYLKASSDNIMIYKGTAIDAYYEYYDPYYENIIKNDALDEEFIRETALNNLSTADLKNCYACAVPKGRQLRMTVGIPETWYYSNCITPTGYINISAGQAYTSYGNKGKEFPNTTALNSANGFLWAMYDDLLITIDSETGSSGVGRGRKIVDENLQDCSVLIIGDSTVDFDTMTRKMLDYFTSKEKTLTLLGTIGDETSDNKNEGRAGWKASDYLTDKTYNDVVNPFYNPTTNTFDFNYYMTNQGYSAPDFVVIQLGINDLYNSGASAIEPTWDCIKSMIDSILDYNDGIHIILNLPTAPNSDPSQHTVFLPLYQNRVIRYNEYAQEQAAEVYGGVSKVRPSYCHLILDPDTDIRDNVHPTNAGFEKMALEVINQINCWQNGY